MSASSVRAWVPQLRSSGASGISSATGTSGPSPPRISDLLTDHGGGDGNAGGASTVFGVFPSMMDVSPRTRGYAGTTQGAVRDTSQAARADRCGAGATESSAQPQNAEVGSGPAASASAAELKVGDSIEARFLLADQAVWTTSWYRGTVSKVNNPSGDEGRTVSATGSSSRQSGTGGVSSQGAGRGGVTYGLEFADGDRLEDVPPEHIRLYRGLQVGRRSWLLC